MKPRPMHCWGGCGRRRMYPDEFPNRSMAVCWWCHPVEQRLVAHEWQTPKALRWWRSTPKYEWQ